jgi:nitroimidazol reductase NimA-like FMN-containing flavoprotein (pyridoxamine 5'-phosphate oxidase superfamily)
MEDMSQWRALLGDLLASQRSAVLATESEGQPYCSLMACAVTGDLRRIILATARATRKYRNMAANPRVALLVDNRTNQDSDLQEALAVTVMGQAREVRGEERDQAEEVFLAKHPLLRDFVASPACALMQVQVEKYYLVRQFQQVTEVSPT